MKKTLLFLLILPVIAFCVFITGCDTESATANNLSVSPSSATVNEGESVTFEVSGGYDYSWSMSEPTWGSLSSQTGSRTTYTSSYAPDTNTTSYQVLTVVSTIEGSSEVSDTNTAYAMSSEVYVEHFSETTDDADNEELSISPTSASLAQWASQEFTASGGSGTYSWTVSSNDWGLVSSSSGTAISYTSIYAPGDDVTIVQIITLTDSDGATTSASITQTD